MIKYLVWEIVTNDMQKRWRTDDLHVSETLFPDLESTEIYCAGPTWESTRVLPSFTMTYEGGRTKVLLLGMSHVDRSRFKRLVGGTALAGGRYVSSLAERTQTRCSYNLSGVTAFIANSFQEVLLLDVTAQNSYMASALIKIAIEELNQRETGW